MTNRFSHSVLRTALVVALLAALPAIADDRDRYMEGKEACVNQQWDRAIAVFEGLLATYPQSDYADDAHFWIAYSLEKSPGRMADAFSAFQRLVDGYPHSSWRDDALVHQVQIAEGLVHKGQEGFRSFLVDHLSADLPEVRRAAALALGRLGDRRATPILETLGDDPVAGDLLAAFADSAAPPEADGSSIRGDLRLTYRTESDLRPSIAPETEEDRGVEIFHGSRRYQLYKRMLKAEREWNREELIAFGLWHIVPADAYAVFQSLDSEYDRQEWLRRFWKRNDPTPTTEKNEFREEFERRVIHARAEFAEPWNNRHARYLPDQYLREGWERAPWDARGELYIKFGEPDFRTVAAWQTEQWTYWDLKVEFFVRNYMTNIYGNAIRGNTLHGRYNRDIGDREYVDANYIYDPKMIYSVQVDGKIVRDIEVVVRRGTGGRMVIDYGVPRKQLETTGRGQSQQIRFRVRYVALNEDLREAASGDTVVVASGAELAYDRIRRDLHLELPEGEYRIGLRVEDLQDERFGVVTVEVDWRP